MKGGPLMQQLYQKNTGIVIEYLMVLLLSI